MAATFDISGSINKKIVNVHAIFIISVCVIFGILNFHFHIFHRPNVITSQSAFQ